MRTGEVKLGRVTPAILRRRAIEPPVIKEVYPLEPSLQRGLGDVEAVFNAVDSTDFVSVIGWNRQLLDTFTGNYKLDNDLGVEVKHVRITIEGDRPKGGDRVHPVATMKL